MTFVVGHLSGFLTPVAIIADGLSFLLLVPDIVEEVTPITYPDVSYLVVVSQRNAFLNEARQTQQNIGREITNLVEKNVNADITSQSPRSDLSPQERKQLDSLIKQYTLLEIEIRINTSDMMK